jgi:agmatinase
VKQIKYFVMNRIPRDTDFNPSGVGQKNGNFIGLPFNEDTARVVLLPVPWDVTVSYREGTALAPQAILDASVQLDLYDPDIEDAWKLGIFMLPVKVELLKARNKWRPKAEEYINFLEADGKIDEDERMQALLSEINGACAEMNEKVWQQTKKWLDQNKLIGLVGGDHSVPLGLLKALSEKHDEFGILQIDAHHDLRDSYEGFIWSHASVFYNALQFNSISKLVQVGIRDYCEEEVDFVDSQNERISVFYDHQIKEGIFNGTPWNVQCGKIIEELPDNVYISFDIDGLDPKLCSGTGTPVPGGLEFYEANYLIKKLVESGRKIIGFDLCEVGNHEWDANVGARILYKLSNWTGRSQGLI